MERFEFMAAVIDCCNAEDVKAILENVNAGYTLRDAVLMRFGGGCDPKEATK